MTTGSYLKSVDDFLVKEVNTENYLITNDKDVISKLFRVNKNVSVIVPDVTQYVRNLTKYGPVGMGLRKLLSLRFNVLKLILPGIKNIRKILQQDFKKVIPLLVLADYYEVSKLKPKAIFLHAQITDLALANNNPELIKSFLKIKVKCDLGLMTNHLTLLHERLKDWGLECQAILSPFNDNGFGMRKSKADCEELVSKNERDYFGFGKSKPQNVNLKKYYNL